MEDKFRHEQKYIRNNTDLLMLKMRLSCGIMQLDPNAAAMGKYDIKSIYFDDFYNHFYFENEQGVQPREKWRIRIYNNSKERISLECKRKENGLIVNCQTKCNKREVRSPIIPAQNES